MYLKLNIDTTNLHTNEADFVNEFGTKPELIFIYDVIHPQHSEFHFVKTFFAGCTEITSDDNFDMGDEGGYLFYSGNADTIFPAYEAATGLKADDHLLKIEVADCENVMFLE